MTYRLLDSRIICQPISEAKIDLGGLRRVGKIEFYNYGGGAEWSRSIYHCVNPCTSCSTGDFILLLSAGWPNVNYTWTGDITTRCVRGVVSYTYGCVELKVYELVGNVNITSTPSGARVWLAPSGQTPVDQGVNTPANLTPLGFGNYDIRLVLSGYQDWTGTISVSSDTTTLSATLTPSTGNLNITSTPSGARIYIDDIDRGVVTPNTITALSSGTHNLRLTLTNYNDWIGTINIISGQTVTTTPTLTLLPGITKIEISPSFSRPATYPGEMIDLGTTTIYWDGTGTIILEKTVVDDRLVITGPNGTFDRTWPTFCGAPLEAQGPFDITNIFVPGNNQINIKIYDVCGDNIGTTGGSIDITGPIILACPTSPKYEGDAITLQATPKDGTGPYYVIFRKNGVTIGPSRLGGLPNPIINAPEDTQITRIYTLDNEDIRTALTGTIDFSIYMEDSCPTGVKTCNETCTINIGCIAPVCNFTVT